MLTDMMCQPDQFEIEQKCRVHVQTCLARTIATQCTPIKNHVAGWIDASRSSRLLQDVSKLDEHVAETGEAIGPKFDGTERSNQS